MFKKDDIILFYGDSITESHRRSLTNTYGEYSLGNGFVNMINEYIQDNHPTLNLTIVNEGISGNRSIDLINRFEKDVISHNPNYLFMMIGVNDVWRMFDSPHINEYMQTNHEFKKNIEIIVNNVLSNKIKLVILTPFYLVLDGRDSFRKKIDEYIKIIKEVANNNLVDVINIQEIFDKLLKTNSYNVYSDDKIHINNIGNNIVKEEIIKYIEKGDNSGIYY